MGADRSSLPSPARLLAVGLCLLGLAAALQACRPRTGSEPPRPVGAAAGRGIRVVTTFLPITLFTRAVLGECGTVTSLVPPAVSPHDFQARPGDLIALREARVLVKNGLGMEGFLEPLIRTAAHPQLRVIDSSRDVLPLAEPEEPGHGGHAHGEHDHGESGNRVNPHIWLDPLRAVQQVGTIRDGLIQADPACADGYRRRASTTIAQIQQLHRDLSRQLAPFRGRTFVAFHDIAPYFAARYGLKAVFLVDVPEMNPTPADLERISTLVKGSRLQALLRDPQTPEGSFAAVARDLGVGIGVFDPLETGSAEASEDPATYVRVMRGNGTTLARAFGG